jgi:hypothetical protein
MRSKGRALPQIAAKALTAGCAVHGGTDVLLVSINTRFKTHEVSYSSIH